MCPNTKAKSTIAALNFFEDPDNIEDTAIYNALELCEMVDLEPEELFDQMPGDWEDEDVPDVTSGSENEDSDSSLGRITMSNCFKWLFPVVTEGVGNVQKWMELDK